MCILNVVAKTKRVQVLMEPLEFEALERVARSRGRGYGGLGARSLSFPTEMPLRAAHGANDSRPGGV
jgi:hypothetical protein